MGEVTSSQAGRLSVLIPEGKVYMEVQVSLDTIKTLNRLLIKDIPDSDPRALAMLVGAIYHRGGIVCNDLSFMSPKKANDTIASYMRTIEAKLQEKNPTHPQNYLHTMSQKSILPEIVLIKLNAILSSRYMHTQQQRRTTQKKINTKRNFFTKKLSF